MAPGPETGLSCFRPSLCEISLSDKDPVPGRPCHCDLEGARRETQAGRTPTRCQAELLAFLKELEEGFPSSSVPKILIRS